MYKTKPGLLFGLKAYSPHLAHLSERLDNLGHDLFEIPDHVLREGWDAQRSYIRTIFNLPCCDRCKLPCAPEDMHPVFRNICNDHDL